MTLYSRNLATPVPLPARLVLSSGFTRTDPASFTADEIADAGYVAAPDNPEVPAGQVLEWTGTAWLLRPVTDPERQVETDAAWERIKTERDRRRFEGGVKVGNNWFLSTNQAIGEYTALALIGASLPGATVLRAGWRTMQEGVMVDMTPTLVGQILATGFATLAAIDDAAITHKAAMEAADDPAAYDFSGGWPDIFQET